MFTGNGFIVVIAGYLEQEYGDKQKAWSYTMIVVGLIMTVITIYNYFTTPKIEVETAETKITETNSAVSKTEWVPNKSFTAVFASFFQKKQIGIALAFILLFRLGESQLLKMLTPFLIDPITAGGMGLTTQDVGVIYGTFGVLALTVGGILGGIVISRDGLGKWMLPMILAMHLPIIGFILLSHFHPSSVYYVYVTVIAEQFGYGFGFAAFMMYLIYLADGESKTSHYSIATGFMALGMMVPGMLSGYIQEYLGYGNFFIWVFIATIPGLILSRFLIFPTDFGKKTEQEKIN